MVALVIGLLLVGGILAVTINTNHSYDNVQQVGRQLENGRFAIQVLSDDIEHAGFYGEYHQSDSAPAALPDPCLTTVADLKSALPVYIQGYSGQSGSPLSCLNSADYQPNTDILVVRRADTSVTSGALSTNDIYLQSLNSSYVLDSGANSSSFTLLQRDGTTPADIRKWEVNIYFVSPCSIPAGSHCDASADGGHPIPTLKRLELTDDGTATVMETVPLVEGIEDVRYVYGIDRSGDGAPNASGTSAAFISLPSTVADWMKVVTVQPYLLVRSVEHVVGQSDSKKYKLGLAGTVGPFSDAYSRHLFTSAIRVVNPSSRREQ